MKLSEKGYLKIGNSIVGWLENGVLKVTFDPDKIEFDQADFKDCVVLTVEEAKALLFMSGIFSIEHYTPDRNKELLNNLYRQLLRQDFESTKKYFECFRKNKHFRNEWKRIEQAEKQ